MGPRDRPHESQEPDGLALLLLPDAGILSLVIRQSDRWDGSDVDEAIVFRTELADELRTAEFFETLRAWFLEHGDPPRFVEARRGELAAGASAVEGALVLTLLGAVAGVALDELWHMVKARLLPNSSPLREHLTYLRSLSNEDLAADLAAAIARSTDRQPSDVTLLELLRDDVEIAATFEVPDGTGYLVRASEETYIVRRVRPRDS